MKDEVFDKEKRFHDQWASTIDVEGIKVKDYFEACTAPKTDSFLATWGILEASGFWI